MPTAPDWGSFTASDLVDALDPRPAMQFLRGIIAATHYQPEKMTESKKPAAKSAPKQQTLGNQLAANIAQPSTAIPMFPVNPTPAPVSTAVSMQTSGSGPAGGGGGTRMPAPVDFGQAPAFNQDQVPPMPTQPANPNQNLAEFLGGSTPTQKTTPPQMQGFQMPVFDRMSLFSLTPEMYNNVLDTTKSNIAFNNNTSQQNYSNMIQQMKEMQGMDQAEQQRFTQNLQNRNSVIQGNAQQKQTAFMQSPQEEAGMRMKGEEHITKLRSALDHANRMSEMNAQYNKELKLIGARLKSEGVAKTVETARNESIKTDWDLIKTAVTSLPASAAGGASDAMGSNDMAGLAAILGAGGSGNVETDRKLQAGREAALRQGLILQTAFNYGLFTPGGAEKKSGRTMVRKDGKWVEKK